MIVFGNILKRILKSKVQFLAIIVVPVIFLSMIAYNVNSDKKKLKISVIDNDKTNYSAMIIDSIDAEVKLEDNTEKTKEDIKDRIVNGTLDYALIIPENFTSDVIKGKDVSLQGFHLKESLLSLPTQKFIDGFVNASKSISQVSNGNETKFYSGIESFKNGISVDYRAVGEVDRFKSYMTLGVMLLFMFMCSVFFTTYILVDKENKTFYRSILAPISLRSYMLQNILAFFMIAAIQSTIIFIVLKFIIEIYMGSSTISMYILFMLSSLTCISLGIAISSMSKSIIQACFVGLFIVLPMSFVGGCWWENSMSPEVMKIIGKFTPMYWLMEGINSVLNDNSILSLSAEILMVLIFVIIFFFFGTWRKEDLAK